MATSMIHTGPSLLLKVESLTSPGEEKLVGMADSISFTSIQGQRAIFVVDTPFPQEISQGAAPSFCRGTMTVYLPKGTTLESAGLVPYRLNKIGENYLATSEYIKLKLYDRVTEALVYAIDNCKVGQYSITVQAKNIVKATLQFEGMYVSPGLAI